MHLALSWTFASDGEAQSRNCYQRLLCRLHSSRTFLGTLFIHKGLICSFVQISGYNLILLQKYISWFSETLRREYASEGIIIQAIAPWLVCSKMSKVCYLNSWFKVRDEFFFKWPIWNNFKYIKYKSIKSIHISENIHF